MVYSVYSGTMIVTVYRYTGIQVYRVYRESTGSTVWYSGLEVYKESTDSIQAQLGRGHCWVFYLSEDVSTCQYCEACPIFNNAFGDSRLIMHGCNQGAIQNVLELYKDPWLRAMTLRYPQLQ